MPPRDPRLCPDLERALPADSGQDSPGYRIVREPREVLFTDGQWRAVELRAGWRDSLGRWIVKLEWAIDGDRRGGAFLWAEGKMRDAGDDDTE